MRAFFILAWLLVGLCFLAACNGGSSSPPPPPPPPPVAGPINIAPTALWSIMPAGSRGAPAALVNGGFDFPVCADPTTCWVGYVESGLSANISSAAAVTMNYTITGDSPVFSKQTNPDNTCPEPAAVRLYLHVAGDPNLSNPYGRWFSIPPMPLVLGTFTLTASLHDLGQWTPVYPPGTAVAFSAALMKIGSVGFVFGGGCFAGHGVAVTSGSARFTLNSYTVQ